MKVTNITTNPKVSIAVPCYNTEQFVGHTIGSLLSQSFRDIEILAVDDGSTDNTLQEIKKYTYDTRLRVFTKSNGGCASAINYAFKRASGDSDFFTWCSSDNIYFSDFVETLYNFILEAPEYVRFVYGDFVYIDSNNRQISSPIIHKTDIHADDLQNGYDQGMVFLFDRALWEEVKFPEGELLCEDAIWLTEASKFTDVAAINKVLGAFRVREGQATGSDKEAEEEAANKFKSRARAIHSDSINFNSEHALHTVMGYIDWLCMSQGARLYSDVQYPYFWRYFNTLAPSILGIDVDKLGRQRLDGIEVAAPALQKLRNVRENYRNDIMELSDTERFWYYVGLWNDVPYENGEYEHEYNLDRCIKYMRETNKNPFFGRTFLEVSKIE